MKQQNGISYILFAIIFSTRWLKKYFILFISSGQSCEAYTLVNCNSRVESISNLLVYLRL